jgi:hypothetical protein
MVLAQLTCLGDTMNGKANYTIVPPPRRDRAVQDEWGMYDPDQAGLKAAFRALNVLNGRAQDSPSRPAVHEPAPQAITAPQPMMATQVMTAPQAMAVPRAMAATTVGEPVFESDVPDTPDPPKTAEQGAVYSLEFATNCPQCCKKIQTVRVSRLLRTQVSFTSTLPRKGYIIVCPNCDGILSAELSGLI